MLRPSNMALTTVREYSPAYILYNRGNIETALELLSLKEKK